MKKVALAVVAVTWMGVTSSLARAEPLTLTASQMESVTAGALIEINIPIAVQTNLNLTTQVANAIALAFATCGICGGGAPDASSLAATTNANVSGQFVALR